jgi:transposase
MYYGQALRKRVLAFYDEGLKTQEIAQRLRVSKSYCRRVKQRREEPPQRIGGRAPKFDEKARLQLAAWIEHSPDATLAELRERLASELDLQVSIGAIWSTLRRMKFTLKKSR